MPTILEKVRESVKQGRRSGRVPKLLQTRDKEAQMQCGGRYARYPKKV